MLFFEIFKLNLVLESQVNASWLLWLPSHICFEVLFWIKIFVLVEMAIVKVDTEIIYLELKTCIELPVLL